MRITKTLAILAPAALALTACGGNSEEAAEGDTAATTVDTGAEAGALPAVPADARSTVDFAGSYEQRSADGRMSSLTLGADDTYKMTNAEGVETSGTYNWYSDNSRILIKEGEETMVFAVADGVIYQMADADAPVNGTMSEEQAYRKSITLEY